MQWPCAYLFPVPRSCSVQSLGGHQQEGSETLHEGKLHLEKLGNFFQTAWCEEMKFRRKEEKAKQ